LAILSARTTSTLKLVEQILFEKKRLTKKINLVVNGNAILNVKIQFLEEKVTSLRLKRSNTKELTTQLEEVNEDN